MEQAWTWLTGLQGPAASPALRALPLLAADNQSLTAATALYAGDTVQTDDEFLSLHWLENFARSGRHLLLCHAMTLLDAWLTRHRRTGTLVEETDVLNRLSISAGQCANLLLSDQLHRHGEALHKQIQRVLRLKTQAPTEQRCKAISLLQAADVLQQGEAVRAEACSLLDQCLPHLIAVDGGPLLDDLVTHIQMVQAFLEKPDLTLGEASRNALDRARPFLAMLLCPRGTYALLAEIKPVAAVTQTAALRHAPHAHVARLTAGKSVAIAMPVQPQSVVCLSLFSNGHALCKAGLFEHAPDDDHATLTMTSDGNDSGQWFQQTSRLQQRTVFMAAAGDDLRIEDQIIHVGKPAWMRLSFEGEAKISVARNGTQATIALDGRNLWQLTLRGGVLLPPGADRNGNQWLVRTSGDRVNWAFKRISRPGARQPRESLPELPF